jgi:hypothetical protein
LTKLPTPEQWALVRMTEIELAEKIEKFIDFVDEQSGRSVHLPIQFVRHFLKHEDDLPIIVAIATLPIVLADGGVLAKEYRDFDEKRGIHFVIPREMLKILPLREQCDDEAVRRAMKFLYEDWLVDVATDHAGKATIVAAALTIIERSLLPDRPAFFITAGRRGSGKTTLIKMLIMAVTGIQPAASAWSSNEEERRKALLSYFLFGVPYILWDNIKRGTRISCPHIEKSCTSAYYADRKLGVSEMIATAASSIHLFTGNNVEPGGDLASRSLSVRIEVDRADPENREFRHPDPVDWTESNRAEILRSLFVILLGNPALALPRDAPMKTRFKLWQRLVGSAVEHAAELLDQVQKIDFSTLFRTMDEEDEEETSLAEVLNIMSGLWSGAGRELFLAQDLCDAINDKKDSSGKPIYDLKDEDRELLRSFFCPKLADDKPAVATTVGRKLKQHVGEPVCVGGRTLILRTEKNPSGGKSGKFYKVVTKLV